MKKIFVFFIIIFTILLTGCFNPDPTGDNEKRYLFEFELISENEYRINGVHSWKDDVETITIPSSYLGVPVTEIASTAFKDARIKSVTFEEGIKVIGKRSFANCHNLIKIKLPNSLEEIGENAFEECLNLRRIEIPSNVKKIGDGCFLNCESLSEIKLSDL